LSVSSLQAVSYQGQREDKQARQVCDRFLVPGRVKKLPPTIAKGVEVTVRDARNSASAEECSQEEVPRKG